MPSNWACAGAAARARSAKPTTPAASQCGGIISLVTATLILM